MKSTTPYQGLFGQIWQINSDDTGDIDGVEAHDLKSIRLGYMELGNYSNPHHCTQQEILLFQVVENRKIFRK